MNTQISDQTIAIIKQFFNNFQNYPVLLKNFSVLKYNKIIINKIKRNINSINSLN